ncbi:DDE family transposase [Tepidibacillus fermentans]|uniref:DDE family transposase n=1 Tax=Tepidibacillus fermentans TaxID=1281767 RepID=A0A4R3K6T6_9BACI|nr:DDE family transposase [Tepidibacillus fermentans]
MTTAKEHDRNQHEVLVDDKEAMYVFDRGYVDYERFDRMTDDGYFFVSRLLMVISKLGLLPIESPSTFIARDVLMIMPVLSHSMPF